MNASQAKISSQKKSQSGSDILSQTDIDAIIRDCQKGNTKCVVSKLRQVCKHLGIGTKQNGKEKVKAELISDIAGYTTMKKNMLQHS